MMKTNLGLCAGACLLLAAGCASSDIAGFFQMQGGGNDRIVVGSLEEVAKSTENTLQRLDLKAEVTQQGETIYIASALKSGSNARFKLVLTRDRNGGEERTHIRLEWQDVGAEHMTGYLLGCVDRQH
jgi:hypothetical protein